VMVHIARPSCRQGTRSTAASPESLPVVSESSDRRPALRPDGVAACVHNGGVVSIRLMPGLTSAR
jgi:hypothetical protein